MKILITTLLALTVPFLILSVVYGIEAGDVRLRLWEQSDAAFQASRKKQQTLHVIVMAFSLPYFLLALGTFVTSAIQSDTKGWRIGGYVAAFAALAMVIWSILLSVAVSFDEVFPAWLVAGVLFGLFGILFLTQPRDDEWERPSRERAPERHRRDHPRRIRRRRD